MITPGILESNSLWYKYKTQVWLEKSEQTTVVHNIMRVLRGIYYTDHWAYVSVPVTSGRFLYELMLKRPFMSRENQIEAAIRHNYHIGWEFVQSLMKHLNYPITFPADLIPIHQHWEQAHFQALWLSIIGEQCTELRMSEGWEYSNGASEEFTHAIQLKLGLPKHSDLVFFNTKESEDKERERMRNIMIYDHLGNPISLNEGVVAIEKAISWLKEHALESKTKTLENSVRLLNWTGDMLDKRFYQ